MFKKTHLFFLFYNCEQLKVQNKGFAAEAEPKLTQLKHLESQVKTSGSHLLQEGCALLSCPHPDPHPTQGHQTIISEACFLCVVSVALNALSCCGVPLVWETGGI